MSVAGIKVVLETLKGTYLKKQLVKICDAAKHAAACALLINDYANKETVETSNIFPLAIVSKRFTTGKMSLTLYAKEFLSMQLTSDEFGCILWGTEKTNLVMTADEALTRFFRIKHFAPSLWNFRYQTLQINFVLAHAPGVKNPSAY